MQIATVISATVSWDLAGIRAIGWGWSGVIWLFNIVTYVFLDPLKFAIRYALSGRAWRHMFNEKVILLIPLYFIFLKSMITILGFKLFATL